MQKHLHVKAHLKAVPLDKMPVSALELVHLYEEQNVPVSMQTYTLVITSLLSRQLSVARAQAWDLFAHMRYVAHPDPDVTLYTHMIRACASPVSVRYSSEPEKALDLWTEMTTDQKLTPTVDSYNAVILALCAGRGRRCMLMKRLGYRDRCSTPTVMLAVYRRSGQTGKLSVRFWRVRRGQAI